MKGNVLFLKAQCSKSEQELLRALRAIKEADSILRLGKKWQRLVPNERRPNFEAAAGILRHVTTSKVDSGRRRTLNIKEDGLQHHHDEREARLLERTLKVGTLPQCCTGMYENYRTFQKITIVCLKKQ